MQYLLHVFVAHDGPFSCRLALALTFCMCVWRIIVCVTHVLMLLCPILNMTEESATATFVGGSHTSSVLAMLHVYYCHGYG